MYQGQSLSVVVVVLWSIVSEKTRYVSQCVRLGLELAETLKTCIYITVAPVLDFMEIDNAELAIEGSCRNGYI